MNKKFVILSIAIVLIAFCMPLVSNVVLEAANASGIPSEFPNPGGAKIDKVDKLANKVWGTVTLIAQILAFAAIVFAGIRYMFASAEGKADIKKGMIYLVIGAILVFASATVVSFIVNTAKVLE